MNHLTPARPFARFREYHPALLGVMAKVGVARPDEVKGAFVQQYGDLIPASDREILDNGKERWAYNLEWARSDLNQLGLMDSPARGIWAIAEEGHTWLAQHTDYDQAVRAMENMLRERTHELRGEIEIRKNQAYRWAGKEYVFNVGLVTQKAQQALQSNDPAAFEYKDWYVVFEGQKISPKWLLHATTDIPTEQIITYHAVMIFRRLGFTVEKIGEQSRSPGTRQRKKQKPVKKNSPDLTYDLNTKELEQFYELLNELLEKHLENLPSPAVLHAHPDKQYIQISLTNIGRAYYVMELRQYDLVSWRFAAPEEDENYKRLEQVQPLVPEWQKQFKSKLIAEKWGARRARIGIFLNQADKHNITQKSSPKKTENLVNLPGNNEFEILIKDMAAQFPTASFWEIKARAYAELYLKFIQVTLPELVNLFGRSVRPKRVSPERTNHHAENNPLHYQLLDQKIDEIRSFLAGRAERIPKDDELCDWVQLCYLFDLHQEGQQLFGYIQPENLSQNSQWFYTRTKKYADLCRLKAARKGT